MPDDQHVCDPSSSFYFPTSCGAQWCAVRLGRGTGGERVAIAFSSLDLLERSMGVGHPWLRLCLAGAHEILSPLGVEEVRVDPTLVLTRPGVPGAA